MALPPRRTPWLRRADAVCLAVVGLVACYVAIWQPAVRQENPLLLPHTTYRQQNASSSSSSSATAAAAAALTRSPVYQYMTYDDIRPQQRKDGYTVTYSARGFEIDGRRTLLLGGSIHYARSSPGMWRDLLLKAKHDGLNHIQMYVFWNLHERERGVWDFAGARDLTQFYALAAELGLFLHVRFGPYVCAEWNNGGLPVWLNWIPDMRVRSSNAAWQAEMARFVTHMVDMARPFLASNGGPIVLAQIENEFTAEDAAYVAWCGALVRDLNTSIPWVMCNGKAAVNTIKACNADDCVDFAVNQTRDRPLEPLVWTENEGWYEKWREKPDASKDNDQRSASDVAYAVARWFAVGGAAQNYYMYHGGNNYGRSASAGVTTKYADGVNLHSDGLSNEPKRSHLRKLHEALIHVNDVLLASPRQLPNPQPLGPSRRSSIEDASTLRRRRTDKASTDHGATLSELPQRAFVYESGDRHVSFLENAATTGALVAFNGTSYFLAPQSVAIVLTTTANGSRILFNTSDVAASFPHAHHRVYTPLVDETMLEWQTWSELHGARGVPRKQLHRASPLEQLRVTRDATDYLTYETSFRLRNASQYTNATLFVTTCDANSIVVFLNHRYVGEQHLAFPGGNCSREFAFRLPLKTLDDSDSDSDGSASVQKHYRLTLVSVSLGIYSLGQDHKKGLTGAVRINDDLDLAHHGGHWAMLPGLVGEQLELFDPQWTHSVEWTPVPHIGDDSANADDRVRFPLMAWYKTSFYLPEPAKPSPGGSPVEDVASILLDCIGLTRGRAYVNGHDLGRYWLLQDAHDEFVQRYYHVPTDWLYFDNATANVVVVFDELGGSVATVRLVVSTIVENPAAPAPMATVSRESDSIALASAVAPLAADQAIE